MVTSAFPSWNDWENLAVIVDGVEAIISDADEPPPGLAALFPGARLKRPGQSLLSQGSRTLLSSWNSDTIEKILPGAKELGTNREQRLLALQARLTELEAYKWLAGQQDYKKAVASVHKKSKARVHLTEGIGTAVAETAILLRTYKKDTREFLLLGALIGPLKTHQWCSQKKFNPSYPTKEELEKATAKARDLIEFFYDYHSLHRQIEVPGRLTTLLSQFEKSSRAKLDAYRRPRVTANLLGREYMHDLVVALKGTFGHCSPILLRHLLSLVDYNPSESDMNECISDLSAGAAK